MVKKSPPQRKNIAVNHNIQKKRRDGSIKGEARPVDVHVGKRVRNRRQMLGMSQTELGSKLGISFQQVQKYERGSNRMGASRLYEISRILDVPVHYFYQDMPADLTVSNTNERNEKTLDNFSPNAALMESRESFELMKCYYRIRDKKIRADIRRVIQNFATMQDKLDESAEE